MEDQALRHVEHRHRGRQLVEGADVRVHLALQVGTDALQLGHVDGDADPAGIEAGLEHVEHAPAAGHDGREARDAAGQTG